MAAEPRHVQALLEFAALAYRRPLAERESEALQKLYGSLRQQGLPHERAVRLVLARVFVAPAFLYRLEEPPSGAAAGPVSQWELASRLSYFFTSSAPDERLRQLAAAGKLHERETLLAETRRLRTDARVRRLAAEFGGQWLHIYHFDQSNEKSERHFPEFAALRGAMHEEAIQLFTDFFQHDRSVLSLLRSDVAFVNEPLARHYGIPDISGPEFRRVEGVARLGRGGILTLSATLAQQSGAARTSPILRGNWVSEVLLGERLPRPPKNVPQLPDTAPAGLSERQLIERHSGEEACRKCHARIDPFGFALENFDAIGRYRGHDAAGKPLDTAATLPDGTRLAGHEALAAYLAETRRADFLRQFCRKLLGYALGRGVQLSDEGLLEEMQANLAAHEFRVSAALETIVLSKPFRNIRGREYTEGNSPE